jgi:hypothetical protein
MTTVPRSKPAGNKRPRRRKGKPAVATRSPAASKAWTKQFKAEQAAKKEKTEQHAKAWLKCFAVELDMLAGVIHDRDVMDYIDGIERFEREQPAPCPFQRAMETKGVASIDLAFRVLQEVLPANRVGEGIPPAAVKMIEAIVRQSYPEAYFAQVTISDGDKLLPVVTNIFRQRQEGES